MARQSRVKSTRFLKRPIKKQAVLIIVIVALIVVAWATHGFGLLQPSTPAVIPTQQNVTSSSTPDSKGNNTSLQNGAPSQADKGSGSQSGNTATPPAASNLPLYAPYGNFVSNHNPGKNGSPTQETSVCNTTPGASCYISFTNGSVTTKLPAKAADHSGAAYWYWDVKDDAHLSNGSWTIKAVATSGTQTKTTTDNIPLTIGQ